MNESPSGRSVLQRAIPFLSVIIVGGVAYNFYFFYSRYSENRRMEKERQQSEANRARQTIEMLGGDKLKILAFYATPPAIRAGDHSLLCYGVNAAKSVRIEPPVETLHPAVSHCFEVQPRRDTEYKLIAEDSAGHSATESLLIRVAP